MSLRIFVSYTRAALSQRVAAELYERLNAHGYEVFYDMEKLRRGDKWEDVLYEEIHKSDVVIVLLEEETADSDWVQREVDVARGAFVSILPLPVSKSADILAALDKLALSSHQFEYYSNTDDDFERLRQDIARLSRKTRDNQKDWIQKLNDKWRVSKAEDMTSHSRFILKDSEHPCKIHITTGDMTKVSGIDVLVNSENNFMQMARVFESSRVSSILRYQGSKFNRGKQLEEDTIQDELNLQVQCTGNRPFATGTVLPTSTGHAKSELRHRTGARYIFHAASVSVNHGQSKITLQPVDTDDGIIDCVNSCLDLLLEVNAMQGVIAPEDTEQWKKESAETDSYTPISSIVFPLFGTGHGGRPATQVIHPMAHAVDKFLRTVDQEQEISDVYFAVYAQADVEIAYTILAEIFTPLDE